MIITIISENSEVGLYLSQRATTFGKCTKFLTIRVARIFSGKSLDLINHFNSVYLTRSISILTPQRVTKQYSGYKSP